MVPEFTCPKCGGRNIEEIMADMVVSSEVIEISPEGGELLYGEQTNEGGHVCSYNCSGCGLLIVDDDSEHAEDGLDGHALVAALKHLNANTPAEGVPLITHEELVKRFLDALEVTPGDAMARIWNAAYPNQVRYAGDSMYEWVKEKT